MIKKDEKQREGHISCLSTYVEKEKMRGREGMREEKKRKEMKRKEKQTDSLCKQNKRDRF